MPDRRNAFDVRPVELDGTFPLDDGENAAVILVGEVDASRLLYGEFNRLALIHVSLIDARLIMTPILLTALMRNDMLSPSSTEQSLEKMNDARSWSVNPYVARAKATLQQQREGN